MSSRVQPRRATLGAAVVCLATLGATTGASLAQGAPGHHKASHHKAAHHKAAAPGSGLGAIDVTASSSAFSMQLYSHAGEDVEADIPYSLATLNTGGIGEGLTSVLWPGSTGAHGGDTLNLLGIKGLPPSLAEKLNDPEVALAQTGVGATTVKSAHPGLTMTSTATSTHVSGSSTAGGGGVPVIGSIVGTTKAASTINIAGPRTLTVNSTSSIHNLSIAKVIKIGAVTSTAHAVTNGHSSSGNGHTKVTDVRIAGVKVRIDNKGLHIPGKSLPLVGNTAAKVVNTALKSAGIKIAVTNVKRHVHGAHTIVNAGALVVRFNQSGYKSSANDTGTVLVLGGASIDAQASPGFPPPNIKPPKTPKTPKSPKSGTTTTPGSPGTAGTPAIPGTTVPSATGPGVAPDTAPAPVLTANPISLPKGLGLVWVILGLAAAGLFAFAMKRLPDKVLQPAGTACRLEE